MRACVHVHLLASMCVVTLMGECIFVLAVFVRRPARSGVRVPLSIAGLSGGVL